MSTGRGDQRDSSGRSRDASTDSIDLAAFEDSSHTHAYDAQTGAEVERPAAERSRVEANVILIAHPEHKMLGTRFRLSPRATIDIGRAPTAEISLPEVLSISRTHARLHYDDDGVTIEDLGSTNGTYVNDRPIKGRHLLRSGNRFQVGAVHFKFVHEQDVEHAYHEAIYDLVMRDGLTEIYNKRKFDEEVQREFARAVRHRRPLALILFDLDHFKQINDGFGHLCGDFILKQIAALTRDLLRPESVFARVGGEEFVILSPETEAAGAVALAEKLRERIAANNFVFAGCAVPVTCSFGVAGLEPALTGPDRLYAAADRALYLAKNDGRNRVKLAIAEPPAPTAS